MIDENLPIFYFQQNKEKGNFDTPILQSQYGVEATPVYTLRRLDPTSVQAKNRYAIALYDAYVPDLIYGEVILEPDWTQPSLSADAVKNNGGVPPPPQPLMPSEFTIQLYNPDQQVKVRHVPPSWRSEASWEFAMPQETFRRPSASTLDRTESDPTVLVSTPMINMRWKRMGKFSNNLMCYLTGKNTNIDGSKKKQKEPDIPLSYFHHFSELTLYEPNVMRLDMEDLKGFEVVILLGATTIRDVFFHTIREAFHIWEIEQRSNSQTPTRKASESGSPIGNLFGALAQRQQPPLIVNGQPVQTQPAPTGPSRIDPRTQWEIDNETARLRQQVDEEEVARRRQEHEDRIRAKLLAEEELKSEKARQASLIEKETARLRQEWETERARIRQESGSKPTLPPRREDKGKQKAHHSHHQRKRSHQPYLGTPQPDIESPAGILGPEVPRPKTSLAGGFNIFRTNDDKERKMLKKKSAIW